MGNLLKKVLDFNKQHLLFSKNDRILLAVSGGIDSMVLLEVFYSLRNDWNLQLAVAHLNHKLRPSADREADFVQKECEARRIEFYCESINIRDESKKRKTSIETAARAVRYDFFRRTMEKLHFNIVATGHNTNDQAETVLAFLLRGSGVTGLGGIKPKREQYIRPLLGVTRKEIEKFAIEHNIVWHEDESNKDIQFRRNKIRHQLIPFLEKNFNPNMPKTLFRLASAMQETFHYLEHERKVAFRECLIEQTDKKIVLDINKYLAYFYIVQKYILLYAIERLSGEGFLAFETISEIQNHLYKKKPKLFRLNPHIWIYCCDRELVLLKNQTEIKSVTINKIPGEYRLWDGYIFEINSVPFSLDEITGKKDFLTEYIDPQTVELPLLVRTVKNGDKFYPLHFSGHSKRLSDYFVDQKIPLYQRNRIPLITCKNQIIWIGGCRLDDRFKIKQKTKTVLRLQLRKKIE
ncbi:tRNA lysidine(34) synthetase TilS [candidate division KSB1 bacterium]|nr:tRNA lysidine(34) synthetase TilS [candidate division KSB1 bacterium]